jgi:uncharacterized protein (DUF488 family)
VVLTIGHSNHALDHFLDLLRAQRVRVLLDVRSAPYAKYATHFNHDQIKPAVEAAGIAYQFAGHELGGRPAEQEHYDADGRADYARMARSPRFLAAIDRLTRDGAAQRIAMMCSEEDPSVCHRHLLVSRVLVERGVDVLHLRGDGSAQTYEQVVRAAQPPPDPQLSLFAQAKEPEWKSPQSVLPRNRPDSSSSR